MKRTMLCQPHPAFFPGSLTNICVPDRGWHSRRCFAFLSADFSSHRDASAFFSLCHLLFVSLKTVYFENFLIKNSLLSIEKNIRQSILDTAANFGFIYIKYKVHVGYNQSHMNLEGRNRYLDIWKQKNAWGLVFLLGFKTWVPKPRSFSQGILKWDDFAWHFYIHISLWWISKCCLASDLYIRKLD